jgi:hypothetical protein
MGNTARSQGSGRFTSRTATRMQTDEHIASTVEELPDGARLLTAPPEIEEFEDGTRIITAPVPPDGSVKEEVVYDEPMIFTNPSQPTGTLAGTLFKIGPGKWKQTPRGRFIRFVNGHAAVRTEAEAERIRQAYPTPRTGNPRVWQEPAPLLSEEKAIARGLEPPYLIKNGQGQVVFWTYHRKAAEVFQQTYHAHHGI